MTFDIAGRTHNGLKRAENQDEVFTQIHLTGGKKVACLAVADGMGGHKKGREASQTAISTVKERLNTWFKGEDAVPTEKWCYEIEEEAHKSVSKISQSDEVVGTTLTLALLTEQECLIGHVGDSRVYSYRSGKLDQITEDQTWEAYAAKNNVENTYGKALRQAIGAGERIVPETYRVPLQPEDWILVCSDGLYKMVDEEYIEDALSHSIAAEDACLELVNLALEGGGKDNIAVCVARYGKVFGRRKRNDSALVAACLAVVIVLILLGLAVTGNM